MRCNSYTNYNRDKMSFTYKYPHPAVTTDCVILTFHEDQLKILLIRRGIEPFKGSWALPGGFLRMDESAEEGALRELKEETGVTGCMIKQFHTFSAPGRDPRERVITIAFYALMKWQKAIGADDAEFADWLPVNMLPPLAFDHKEIIRFALEAIKKDIFFEPVGFELLNEIFSMSELQKVYEAILGREFDRRNFAKKMKHLNILEEVVATEERMDEPKPQKKLPLPFLNIPDKQENSHFDPLDMNMSDPTGFSTDTAHSIFYSDDSCVEERECRLPVQESRPKASKRRGLFWRFNRKKYDQMKNDDTLEF